jgi:hypothetical protein
LLVAVRDLLLAGFVAHGVWRLGAPTFADPDCLRID